MQDLAKLFQDLMAFAAVVDAGGFNAAGARFGTPPSRLSRSVAALEKNLGVPLLVRSSRRFAVTDVGWRTFEDAVRLRSQLQGAAAAASDSGGEPSGLLRVLCPMALASVLIGRIAITFMARLAPPAKRGPLSPSTTARSANAPSISSNWRTPFR